MQTLTPLYSLAPIYPTRDIAGITILVVAGRTLAASRSRARWYDLTDGACGCEEFSHRGRCAHWRAALQGTPPPAASLRAVS